MMAAKKDKAEVNYSKGMPESRCGICKHYIGLHQCELVMGYINPMYWCTLFAKRAKDGYKDKAKP